jgi:hypothetical protein
MQEFEGRHFAFAAVLFEKTFAKVFPIRIQ